MVSEIDIFRTAQVLIHQHRELAYLQAVKRRDSMRRKGDAGGEVTWNGVTNAVVRLTGDDGRGAVH